VSRLFKDAKKCPCAINAVPLRIRGLLHNTIAFESFNRALCRSEGKSQLTSDAGFRDERIR
jgi:hypothetical protein